jgi:hypothetical protein
MQLEHDPQRRAALQRSVNGLRHRRAIQGSGVMAKKPIRVAVTGGRQHRLRLLFRIASGQMFGADQPVILQLLEIPSKARRRR